MKSIFKYIISPKDSRYQNTAEVGGKELIINTDMFNHKHISRNAIVLATPSAFPTPIKRGMEVVVHHNIFRRWHDVRGNEKNSMSFIDEDKYTCNVDQIYMYKDNGKWKGLGDYCFVSPVKNDDILEAKRDKTQVGILEVGNEILKSIGVTEGDTIGFLPSSEYEFIVDGKLMYRMSWEDICIKFEDGIYEPYQPELPQLY